MKKTVFVIYFFIFSTCLFSLISGCAGITPPTPDELISKPLGKGPLRLGMVKDEVKSVWGEPDVVNVLEESADRLTKKEEWIYFGRYSGVPVDTGYLSKTQYLYFDGQNLIRFGEDRTPVQN